jgi:hypothetical protein
MSILEEIWISKATHREKADQVMLICVGVWEFSEVKYKYQEISEITPAGEKHFMFVKLRNGI